MDLEHNNKKIYTISILIIINIFLFGLRVNVISFSSNGGV
jgi:hypothetical protein